MALVAELFSGRSEIVADKSSAEVPYVVFQATDEANVKAAILADVPPIYSGMSRISYEITERINADTWKVLVRYETTEEDAVEEPQPQFSFDTGGGTQHITQSLDTRSRYGSEASTELGGAIGFDGENVQGVDITVPAFNFSETHIIPASVVTAGFKMTLFLATGTTNNAPFRGFEAGEVLFAGASGSRRGTDVEDDWEITFNFSAQPNKTDIEVGTDPVLGPITKRGWDYMWVQYGADVDEDRQILIKKPVAVFVEQVYAESNFALLGIGIEEL